MGWLGSSRVNTTDFPSGDQDGLSGLPFIPLVRLSATGIGTAEGVGEMAGMTAKVGSAVRLGSPGRPVAAGVWVRVAAVPGVGCDPGV